MAMEIQGIHSLQIGTSAAVKACCIKWEVCELKAMAWFEGLKELEKF